MSRAGQIARRTFLIGSAAVAGGVAFGVYVYKRPAANPLVAGQGEAALTPYVLVTATGVTLITPRMDSGQGAYSLQAMLIAEELDVDLDRVTLDPGPPDPAYYNTALASEAVPFMSTDEGRVAQSARSVMDAMVKFLGVQITGGSTTVPDAFDKLRAAGAVARETLKLAAAKVSGVPPADLRTGSGGVILPDGRTLAYTSLATQAAAIAPPRDVALRPPEDWRLIGTPVLRTDMVAKSTGTHIFGIDLDMEGMLHAAVRLNPAQGGGLAGYDDTAAKGMRGVRAVVPVSGGVAVVADNTWRAQQAAAAIVPDWTPAPMPADMVDHWAALADSFTDAARDSRSRDDGDVEAALAGAQVIAAEYRAPYLAHAPLEPLSAVARVSGPRVDVWAATQIPRFTQANVAKIAGVDPSAVHLHVQTAGGSFGHRLEDEFVRHAVQIAMAVPDTPVKLTYTREEDMRRDYVRQIAMGRARGDVADGQVMAMDLGIAMPSVIASQMGRQGFPVPGPDLQIVAGAWDQPFAVPHLRVTGYRAPELAPVSSWRSVGASTNAFMFGGFLDELMVAAGADPLSELLRLCSHGPSRRVLETVGEMSGWPGRSPAPGKGFGIAFAMSFGVPVAEVVEVTATDAGIRMDNVWVAADVGRVVDPVNFEGLVQGGVLWGLGHAIHAETTYVNGVAQQDNFDTFGSMRMHQTPNVMVRGLENGSRIRGIGEPPVPPAAAALANAVYGATGTRLREMPFAKSLRFV
jgi:isoquinoline 1-oxidoreductase beta subunit